MADEYFLYDGVDNVFSEEEVSHPNRFPVLAQEAGEQDETSEHAQSPSTTPHPHHSILFSPSPVKESDSGTPSIRSLHYFPLYNQPLSAF